MSKVNVYNLEGKVVGEADLEPAVFEVKAKPELIHFVAIGLSAGERQSPSHAKTRGEVRGGGRKPWKQKGTGRARHGSIRSPLWRGGGIIFGPRSDRNFKIKINKKVRKLAFKMVLSDKVREKSLVLVESFDLPEAKTKIFAKLLKSLPLVGKKVLIIFAKEAENLLDVLGADTILTTREAVEFWQKVYR